MTHYQLLSMPPASTTEALHARYLELAYELHPDRGGDEEKFKALAAAWGVLKDKARRANYDDRLRVERVLNCAHCAGRGVKSYQVTFTRSEEKTCRECGGSGIR
jgi:curved DNA-binding protein CbpA